ncbi:MAG: hypothetical protein ACLSHR_11820 [Oscillospiraceae bacterium]
MAGVAACFRCRAADFRSVLFAGGLWFWDQYFSKSGSYIRRLVGFHPRRSFKAGNQQTGFKFVIPDGSKFNYAVIRRRFGNNIGKIFNRGNIVFAVGCLRPQRQIIFVIGFNVQFGTVIPGYFGNKIRIFDIFMISKFITGGNGSVMRAPAVFQLSSLWGRTGRALAWETATALVRPGIFSSFSAWRQYIRHRKADGFSVCVPAFPG